MQYVGHCLIKQMQTYILQFPSSSALDLTSSLRRSSGRHNKSVESLRSKSWAQYVEGAESHSPFTTSVSSAAHEDARAQAAFYGQPRRFSYGWPEPGSAKGNYVSPNMIKSRLTTSHSYSDLHDAALRSYYAGTTANATNAPAASSPSMHHDAMVAAAAAAAAAAANDVNGKDMSTVHCPQFQQYGFCVLDEQCPFAHNPSMANNGANPNGLGSPFMPMDQHPAATAAAAAAAAAAGADLTLPFYASSMYQQYSMLNNLATSTAPAYGKPGAGNLTSSMLQYQRYPNNMVDPRTNSNINPPRRAPMSASSSSTTNNEEPNRFAGAKLEDFIGKIYDLCKDQNGCRFLQKKLEEPNRQNLQLCFEEVQPNFAELMTGNIKREI